MVADYMTHCLRTYYHATGWNDDNLYSNLDRSSRAILDFVLPKGLHFSVSRAPTGNFRSTSDLVALPQLNGSIGYLFSSTDLDRLGSTATSTTPFASASSYKFPLTSSATDLKELCEPFRIYPPPYRPKLREVWRNGELIREQPTLAYGRLYLPSARLDALYTKRIGHTKQIVVAAISDNMLNRSRHGASLMANFQTDVGRWASEWTYSSDNAMLGVRGLYNFASSGDHKSARRTIASSPPPLGASVQGRLGADESVEEELETALTGRWALGGEIYYSALQRSGGMSTGIKFTTIPGDPSSRRQQGDAKPGSEICTAQQTPTTITATLNPLMGHLTTSYSASVTADLAASARYHFNLHSWDSTLTIGLEWWRRAIPLEMTPRTIISNGGSECQNSLAPMTRELDTENVSGSGSATPHSRKSSTPPPPVIGVFKAKVNTNSTVALLYQGQFSSILVSFGILAHLRHPNLPLSDASKVVKSFGSEIIWFGGQEAE